MPTTNPEASDSSTSGQYFGRLLLEPLPDGRRMRLAEPFGFLDAKRKRWPVPRHAIVDGASIPQALWSVAGGPFDGKYRDASVVHDYYCSVRLEPWKAVHRVFYEAMLASDVSPARAKLMYAAVYFAGPRWSDMDTANTRLPRIDDRGQAFCIDDSRFGRDVLKVVSLPDKSAANLPGRPESGGRLKGEAQLHMDLLQRLIQDYDPTLREIESALDQALSTLESKSPDHIRIHTLVAPPLE